MARLNPRSLPFDAPTRRRQPDQAASPDPLDRVVPVGWRAANWRLTLLPGDDVPAEVDGQPELPLTTVGNPVATAGDFAARLGISPRQLAHETLAAARERVARAVHGMLGNTSRAGDTDRATRIRQCGRLRVAATAAGKGGLVLSRCRDRVCPRCAADRATINGHKLRAWMEKREGAVLFVTLTHRKRPASEESCKEAIDRIRSDYRRVFNVKNRAGQEIADCIVGGVRVIELTWSPKGWRHGPKGDYFVEFSGWHAHLHMLVELKPGAEPGHVAGLIQRRWLALVDAEPGAQKVKPANLDNCGQLAKYVVKPLGLTHGGLLRQAASAVASMHAMTTFGEWTGCLRKVADNADGLWKVLRVFDAGLEELRWAALNGKHLLRTRYLPGGVTLQDAIEARAVVAEVAIDSRLVTDVVKDARRPDAIERARSARQVAGHATFRWLLLGDGAEPKPCESS